MSRSPSEPENATPTPGVSAGQGLELQQDGGQSHSPRCPPRQRSHLSLISQLLSNSHETGGPSELAPKPHGYTQPGATIIQDDQDPSQIHDPTPHKHTADRKAADTTLILDGGSPHDSMASPISITRFNLHNINASVIGHPDSLCSRRGRGTSLERTQKERKLQGTPKIPLSLNPGDTGMIHIPQSHNPTTVDEISNTPPTDGVRAQYRSWRDTHGVAAEKAWSIGEQGPGDVPEGQVEKSIAEALAGIEPNSRSRKASHSLRFFKEGLPEDKQRKRGAKDNGRSKDRSPQAKGLASSSLGGPGYDNRAGESPNNSGTKFLESEESDKKPFNENSQDIPFWGEASQSLTTDYPDRAKSDADQADGATLYHEGGQSAIPQQQLRCTQRQLKLPPRSERSLSASSDPHPTKIQSPTKLKTSTRSSSGDQSPVKGRSEDEDSGEEQISSALFVPHQSSHGRSDSDLPEIISYRDIESDRRSGSMEPEQWLVQHQIPGDIGKTDDEESVTGDQSPMLADRGTEHGVSDYFPRLSRKEAQIETLSDVEPIPTGEESSPANDPEITPTGKDEPGHFMSKHRKSHLHNHQLAKAPLEAIELIPYRHQVGGHTTLWRFSKRAVCKKLNNRENEFYETVEKYHPKLLKFMPRCVYFD